MPSLARYVNYCDLGLRKKPNPNRRICSRNQTPTDVSGLCLGPSRAPRVGMVHEQEHRKYATHGSSYNLGYSLSMLLPKSLPSKRFNNCIPTAPRRSRQVLLSYFTELHISSKTRIPLLPRLPRAFWQSLK